MVRFKILSKEQAGDMVFHRNNKSFLKRLVDQKYLMALLLPGLLYYIILKWGPMFGMTIAFKRYNVASGILGSPWVGFKYFVDFVENPYFFRVIRNTVLLCFYQLTIAFPVPIVFALLLNEIGHTRFKKLVQTVSYLPHFISVVIVIGLLKQMLSPTSGIVNQIISSLGGDPVNFFMKKQWFRTLYIGTGLWQEMGWGAILYISAIANIDPQLYEAAKIDGGGRFRCMWSITIPGILPTIVIVFLLNLGQILNIGFEKVLLMYNPAIYEKADLISTFVYRSGLQQGNYSFGAAVDLMNAVVTIIIIAFTNRLSRKLSDISLW
jgi:putative aldouronate transport system permease protein